jgi:hypothetical protein
MFKIPNSIAPQIIIAVMDAAFLSVMIFPEPLVADWQLPNRNVFVP